MKFPLVCMFVAGSLCVASAQTAPAPAAASKYVLTIDGEGITQADFEALLETLPDSLRARATTQEGRRALAEEISQVIALAHEARKLKLDKDPQIAQEMKFSEERLLASVVVGKMVDDSPVTDEELKKYYQDHIEDYQELEARHILIRFTGSQVPVREGQPDLTEPQAHAKADEIYAKLIAGADFATVAKEESDDTSSAAAGGALGTFTRGSMVGEFEEKAFALKKGEISKPFETPFGYHIVQVTDRTNRPFEEVRNSIEQQVKPMHARQLVQDVRDRTQVTMSEDYFGKAAPAAEAQQ